MLAVHRYQIGKFFFRNGRYGMAFYVGKIDVAPLRSLGTIFDVAGKRALPVVKIEGDDPGATIGECDRHMHRGSRFARSALLVGEGDPVRGGVRQGCIRLLLSLCWLTSIG